MLKNTKLGFVFNHGAEKKISEVDCFGLIEEAKIDLEKSEQMIQKVLVTNSQAENHSSILAYLARHIECLSEKKITTIQELESRVCNILFEPSENEYDRYTSSRTLREKMSMRCILVLLSVPWDSIFSNQ